MVTLAKNPSEKTDLAPPVGVQLQILEEVKLETEALLLMVISLAITDSLIMVSLETNKTDRTKTITAFNNKMQMDKRKFVILLTPLDKVEHHLQVEVLAVAPAVAEAEEEGDLPVAGP